MHFIEFLSQGVGGQGLRLHLLNSKTDSPFHLPQRGGTNCPRLSWYAGRLPRKKPSAYADPPSPLDRAGFL